MLDDWWFVFLFFFSRNVDKTFFVRYLENSKVTLLRYILCSKASFCFLLAPVKKA